MYIFTYIGTIRYIRYRTIHTYLISLSPPDVCSKKEKKGELSAKKEKRKRQQKKTGDRQAGKFGGDFGERPYTYLHDTKFACIVLMVTCKYVIISTTQVFRVQYL